MGDLPAFSVGVRFTNPSCPVVEVHGEVDVATAPELADYMAAALARDPVTLVLDLTDTTFFDCSGIAVVVTAAKHLSERSRLVLRRPRPFIRTVFGILEIDAVCAITD
jgi:anti-sigma B factor antagonist